MELSDNDKLNIALEFVSKHDLSKYEAIVEIAETDNVDIYTAINKYLETE